MAANDSVADRNTGIAFPLIIRGRGFTENELTEIRNIVLRHQSWGRWRISLLVCERLSWFQPNGWPKDRACRDVLLSLEKLGHIRLPTKGAINHDEIPKDQDPTAKYSHKSSFKSVACSRGEFIAKLAKGNSEEIRWNNLIKDNHYLGHKVSVGRTLKFLVFRDQLLVGRIFTFGRVVQSCTTGYAHQGNGYRKRSSCK